MLAPLSAVAVGLCTALPGTILAYIGPGGGLSAIGAFLAVVACVFVAVFGFVWYPVKRLLRKGKAAHHGPKDGD